MNAKSNRLTSVVVVAAICFALPSSVGADDTKNRQATMNNLKRLALAMHNFHDVHRSLPPHASFKKGKPLLSWRVYLLPYLGQKKLFDQFHLDEPWDGPNNKKLIAKMPKLFSDPYGLVKKAGMTRYVGPLGAKCIFSGKAEGIRFGDITDGTSNTLMIVEAAPKVAVVWTRPADLNFDTKKPAKGLFAKDQNGFSACFGDGSARYISRKNSIKTLRSLLTRNGGEVIGEIE